MLISLLFVGRFINLHITLEFQCDQKPEWCSVTLCHDADITTEEKKMQVLSVTARPW